MQNIVGRIDSATDNRFFENGLNPGMPHQSSVSTIAHDPFDNLNGHPTIKGGDSVHSASVENFQTFTSPEHIHNETINTSACNVCH